MGVPKNTSIIFKKSPDKNDSIKYARKFVQQAKIMSVFEKGQYKVIMFMVNDKVKVVVPYLKNEVAMREFVSEAENRLEKRDFEGSHYDLDKGERCLISGDISQMFTWTR